jgi:hypothetical protein
MHNWRIIMKTRKTLLMTLLLTATLISFGDTAQPLSVLLEKAIYTEETVGDRGKAIAIYEQLLQAGKADQEIMAEAHFRLGRCYAEDGRKKEALEILGKLQDQYPDQTALVKQGNALSAELRPKLEFNPVPWDDGESLWYGLSANGTLIGTQHWFVSSTNFGNRMCWILGQDLDVKMANMRFHTEAVINQQDLSPVYSHTENQLGTVHATYHAGKVTLQSNTDKEGESTVLDIDGTAYDNEQILFLIRCLPLAKNYEVTLPLFASMGSQRLDCQVQVIGRENISVPRGTFDCWKVKIAVYLGALKTVSQTFWFDVQTTIPIKIDAGHINMVYLGADYDPELKPEVTQTVPEQGSQMVDPALKEIRVTFNSAMKAGSWSWCTSGEGAYPKTGTPEYTNNGKTCLLGVQLEPNTQYAIWINTRQFDNFKSIAGVSAKPYLLKFKTR